MQYLLGFEPKQKRRKVFMAEMTKYWKQNSPEAWRFNMLALWHWDLVDEDDLAAMFAAQGLDPPRQNEFKPHHLDCESLIHRLTRELTYWNPADSPVLEDPDPDPFPPETGIRKIDTN